MSLTSERPVATSKPLWETQVGAILEAQYARLGHPAIFSLHDDDSTMGGPHPIPGAVFNNNLLILHTNLRPVRAPLMKGAPAFEYVNNIDVPRSIAGGEIGKLASACLNPLSTKVGDLVNFSPYRFMELYGRHEAVYDGLEGLTPEGTYRSARTPDQLVDGIARGANTMVRHVEGLTLPKETELAMKYVDRLIERGVRSFGIIWNEPTLLATTCYFQRLKMEDAGLTDQGKEIVAYLLSKGMIVDLSHSSPKTMEDTLKIATTNDSILGTHIASRRLTDHARNVHPDIAQEIVKRGKGSQGGLVGVPFVRSFVLVDSAKEVSVWDVVAHIQDFRKLFGSVDNIGLGPDFGGTMIGSRIPGLDDIEIAGRTLAAALRETREFDEREIAKIFYYNAINYLNQNLPQA